MTTEQRRALADTIPTTEVIRDAVTFPRDRLGEPLDISPERFEAWLARVRRDAAREVGQYIERHHPDGLTEKTTVLGYIDTAADRMGRGIHANGRDRETP